MQLNVVTGFCSLQLSSRREARDAFFSKDRDTGGVSVPPAPKSYDPNLRPDKDRDREKDKSDRLMASTGSHHMSSHQSQHPKGGEVIDGYVGFANLPNQVYRKSVKKGFEFTLMVVGEWVGNFQG